MIVFNSHFKKLLILGFICIFLFFLAETSSACRLYGVISNGFPDGLLQFDMINAPNSLKNLAYSTNTDGWGIAYYPYYLVDLGFNDSSDSAELRADCSGQDWYESRDDLPSLLTLNTTDIGGNTTKKAEMSNYGISSTVYLTQNFSSPQTGIFIVSFDIFIDRIENNENYDRTGLIYIGDDRITTNAPTGTSDERCVFMTFYDSTPGDSGNDLELRARTSSSQSFRTTSEWLPIVSGLSYDTWYTIKIVLDVVNGIYDVFINDVLENSHIPKYSGYTSDSVTHISFVADSNSRGEFYVDNVRDTIERGAERAFTDTTYDDVIDHLETIKPKVTLAHIRRCTSGCCDHDGETIPDPHPFYRYKNGKRWVFAHNGYVPDIPLKELIGPYYLAENPPNGSDILDCIEDTVDSELYFLYLLKMIEDNGWDTTTGIIEAVNELIDQDNDDDEEEFGMNFILSDGDTLWAFRRPKLSSHTLYYKYYNNTDGVYSAVASESPSDYPDDWQAIDENNLIVLSAAAAPVVIDVQNFIGDDLLVDTKFNFCTDNTDLRYNSDIQDWYESRNDDPSLLTLNTDNIGGNNTKKAALKNYGINYNAYLTQEFNAPQSGRLTISFDIYIKRIEDDDRDRTGYIFIGDDSVSSDNPPTGTSNERFVYLAFYDSTPGTDGDLEIRAREYNYPTQPFSDSSTWTLAASDLSYNTWYTLTIDINVANGVYDLYVDYVLTKNNISKYENYNSSIVEYITFAVLNEGRGDFYIDNVR